jgi:radical SAM superfamily enzyme YgiQ (UPF0313 family)
MAGEGDDAFIAFLDRFPQVDDIRGLVYRNQSSSLTKKAVLGTSIDLDTLPFPARDLLSEDAAYNFLVFGGKRTAQVQTMRGCPFQCSFCNQRNRKPNVRSIENVVTELSVLVDEGYKAVFFDDATFTVSQKRTQSLMAEIISAGLKLEFGCQTRSELLSEETIAAMAHAGFTFVSFGLETADEFALSTLLKTASAERHLSYTTRAVELCQNYGVSPCLNLIVGLPSETDNTLKKTFDFVCHLDPAYVSLSALARYPHEELSTVHQYEEGVSLELCWQNYDEGYGAVHPYMSPERAKEVWDLAKSFFGQRLDVTAGCDIEMDVLS